MAEQKGKQMKLTITECRQVYSGVNKRGDSYVIYEVSANKADGSKVNEKLRSFTSLPVGQAVDVTVVAFNSDKHGRSFTLYPQSSKGGKVSTQDQINELRQHVDELASRLANAVERVARLESTGGFADAHIAHVERQDAAAANGELDAKFGSEAPW